MLLDLCGPHCLSIIAGGAARGRLLQQCVDINYLYNTSFFRISSFYFFQSFIGGFIHRANILASGLIIQSKDDALIDQKLAAGAEAARKEHDSQPFFEGGVRFGRGQLVGVAAIAVFSTFCVSVLADHIRTAEKMYPVVGGRYLLHFAAGKGVGDHFAAGETALGWFDGVAYFGTETGTCH